MFPHPQRLFLQQGSLLLLLRLLLQLVVAHGDDGEDQVDQVERAQEDDQEKEDNVPRSCRPERWKNVFYLFLSTWKMGKPNDCDDGGQAMEDN